MDRDPMVATTAVRNKWYHMDAGERAEKAHDAITYTVIVLEEAALNGQITREGADKARTLLEVAYAGLHEEEN